jgi:hypothetical protein
LASTRVRLFRLVPYRSPMIASIIVLSKRPPLISGPFACGRSGQGSEPPCCRRLTHGPAGLLVYSDLNSPVVAVHV